MTSTPRVLGVIPARGGSKRVPGKNLRQLCGRPLIAYTIEAAQKAKSFTTWVVSTEDERIRDVALSLGAYVIRRPDELATDNASSDSVIRHALDWLESESDRFDIVVCLHPTNPIRESRHIDECVNILLTSEAPSIASVEYRKRSYRHNASIYAAKCPFVSLYCDRTLPYLMDRRHSLDIDDEIDLKIAELFLKESSQ